MSYYNKDNDRTKCNKKNFSIFHVVSITDVLAFKDNLTNKSLLNYS